MWIISKQENLTFCCIQSEHLINYKIMYQYNQFTFSIYHNLYSVWCILLYWWCFLTINTFKTIMIVYFIMSVYYFIYSVDTLIHAYMVTDLSSLDISAKHCIIHNGYCYNNPSDGFHTNINILSIRYEVLLYIKTYHQLLPAIALYGESSVYCRWCSWNLVDILCVDFKYFSKQLMEQLFWKRNMKCH